MAKKNGLALIAIGTFCLLVVLFVRALSINPHALPLERKGALMPTFALSNLWQEHTLVTQQDLLNKVVLLHFWASWCGVCHKEHETLLTLKDTGVYIVGVSYRDDPKAAKKWLSTKGDPFTINISDVNGQLGMELGVYGTPETYVIDKNGHLQHRFVGPLTLSSYRKEIEPWINALKQ
ncbi:MAG TPA: DsbE family thiol:disulfide interchange protein [Gammaproteobacteria bacterium]|nr:DsbE family thiol:disulfide interchange protein [Gammaproteobacteria bacterium]